MSAFILSNILLMSYLGERSCNMWVIIQGLFNKKKDHVIAKNRLFPCGLGGPWFSCRRGCGPSVVRSSSIKDGGSQSKVTRQSSESQSKKNNDHPVSLVGDGKKNRDNGLIQEECPNMKFKTSELTSTIVFFPGLGAASSCKLTTVFMSQMPHTPSEVKACHFLCGASLMSLVAADKGEIMASSDLSREKKSWKNEY